jgi:hypothetical protein
MPLPNILATIVRKFGKEFDPSAQRKEFVVNAPLWRVYLDLLEMDANKLAALVVMHEGEQPAKYEFRKRIAAIFNYVPLIIRMTVNYLHSEQPTYSVEDESLKAFLANCTGSGTSFVDYVRKEALPLALALGWVDVLIQNPEIPAGSEPLTAADQQNNAALLPRTFTITPLQRINWSVRPSHEYNWIRFRDVDNENTNPFINDSAAKTESFLTIAGAMNIGETPVTDDAGNNLAFWFRSWRESTASNLAEDAAQGSAAATTAKAGWDHDGNWLPTTGVPIATLYYQQSIDPERKHFGLSKISMIAILTQKIVQLLSWSDEDVLSNLAIFVFPGDEPKDDKANPKPITISPWGVLYVGNNAQIDPRILQGEVGHIEVKWKIIDAYTREILRLAYLIGASAEPEQITSGVQGVVARTELFQELADLAGALDRFALEALAIAASLIKGENIDVGRLIAEFKPTVNYYKGNYAIDPLNLVIQNANALVETFRDISPTMTEAVYRQLAQSALYNEDARRDTVFREIQENFRRVSEQRAAEQAAIVNAGNAAAADTGTTPNVTEIVPAAPTGATNE